MRPAHLLVAATLTDLVMKKWRRCTGPQSMGGTCALVVEVSGLRTRMVVVALVALSST